MRLTVLLAGLLAKAPQAMPNLFGAAPPAPGRRKTLDERKDHLHQETRVDKRGVKSTRWVRNAEHHAPARNGMPDLFSPAAAPADSLFAIAQQQIRQQTARPPREHAPRAPKPKPSGMPDLFAAPAAQAQAPVKAAPKPAPQAAPSLFENTAPAAPAEPNQRTPITPQDERDWQAQVFQTAAQDPDTQKVLTAIQQNTMDSRTARDVLRSRLQTISRQQAQAAPDHARGMRLHDMFKYDMRGMTDTFIGLHGKAPQYAPPAPEVKPEPAPEPVKAEAPAPAPEPTPAPEPAPAAPEHPYAHPVTATGHGVTATISYNREHNGIQVRFSAKPDYATINTLKAEGYRWSKFQGVWYKADGPGARRGAAALIRHLNPAQATSAPEPRTPSDAAAPQERKPADGLLASTAGPFWVDGHTSKPILENGHDGMAVYGRGQRGLHARNGADQLLIVDPSAKLLQLPKGGYADARTILKVIHGDEAGTAKFEELEKSLNGRYPGTNWTLKQEGYDGMVTAGGALTLYNPKMARGVQHPDESPEERAAIAAYAKVPKVDRENVQKVIDEGEGRLDDGRRGGRGPKFGARMWKLLGGLDCITPPVRIGGATVVFPTGALMRALTGKDRIPVGPNVQAAVASGTMTLGERREFGNGEVYALGTDHWTRVDELELTGADKARMTGEGSPTAPAAPAPAKPGPVDFAAMVAETRAKMDAEKAKDAAKTPAAQAQPAPAEDGTLAQTQAEHADWNAGKLHTGMYKTENGTTYRLNDNHRWERLQDTTESGTYRNSDGSRFKPTPSAWYGTPEAAAVPANTPQRIVTRTGNVVTVQSDGRGGVTNAAGTSSLKPDPADPTLWRTQAEGSTPMWFRQVGDELRYVSTGHDAPPADVKPADIDGHRQAVLAQAREDRGIQEYVQGTRRPAQAALGIQDWVEGLSSKHRLKTGDALAHSAFLAADNFKDLVSLVDHHVDRARTELAPDLQEAERTLHTLAGEDSTMRAIAEDASPQHAQDSAERFIQRHMSDLTDRQRNAVHHVGGDGWKARAAAALMDALRPAPGAAAPRRKIDYSQGFKAALPQVKPYAFDLLPRTTEATRRAANDAAKALAAQIHAEGRAATDAEREVLSRWTGQGGVDGSINAYYTPTKVAAAMWGLMHTHGFQGGRVLEPSIGGGVFAETAPASAGLTGVEISRETSSVTSLLQPDVNLINSPMEEYNTTSADELFDAAIGNPPYGARGDKVDGELVSTRHLDKPDIARNEEYFIDTMLDRVKPGGLVTVLVNSGLMQNANSRAFRARMLARADLITVARIPLSTFEDSGASVTPDVIVLRKRPEGVGEALAKLVERNGEDALHAAGVWREDVMSGHYIAIGEVDEASGLTTAYTPGMHPDHALGEIGGNLRKQGYQTAVRGTLDDETLTRLAEMPEDDRPEGPANLDALTNRLREAGVDEAEIGTAHAVGAMDHYPIPDGAISPDGDLIFRNHRWHRIGENDLPHVRQFLTLSRDVQEFNRLAAQGSYVGAETLRQSILEQISAYHAAHGDPHGNEDVQRAAQRLPYLQFALAAVKDGKATGTLAEPVHIPTLSGDVDTSDFGSVAAALAGQGRLTPEAVADHHDSLTAHEALEQLCASDDFAYNGSRWQAAQDYYWGDAYQQADHAEALAGKTTDPQVRRKLLAQAAHFRTLITPKSLDEIEFAPRDKWVPLDAVEAWMNEYLDTYERKHDQDPITGELTTTKLPLLRLRYDSGVYRAVPVKDDSWQNTSAWRNMGKDGVRDIQSVIDYLNHDTSVERISDKSKMSTEEYEKKRADNVRAARDFESSLAHSFRTFVYSTDHSVSLENEYNRSVNSYIAPPDRNEPFHIEGWNLEGGTPHPFQYATVRKAIAQGSSYIALDVGLGKTFVGLMLAAKLKQDGRARKPTVTCPASMLTEWANEAERMLPGKKVLVLGVSKGKNGKWVTDSAAAKKKKLAQLANENFDLVIMNHELFEAIPMRIETRQELLSADFERERLQSQKAQSTKFKKDGDVKSSAIKDMAQFTAANLAKVKIGSASDICFEDLGIDAIVTDEAHEYKNLYAAPQEFGESVKFLGGGAESNQAMEFQHKAKYIRQQNKDGSGIFCMSATPTKNSPLEVYYALQFVTDDLAKRGIPSTSDFIDRYCIKDTVIVPSKDGSLKPFQGVVGFKNLDELRSIMDRYLIRETARTALMRDRATGELVTGMKLPERDDVQQFFDMSDEAQAMFEGLKIEAQNARKESSGDAHLFSVYSRMRKLSLDPALMGVGNGPNPRFTKAAQIASDSLKGGGKVIMFMDNGEGTSEDEGDDSDATSYDRLVQHCVESGIPADQIKVVTGKTASKAERAQIAADFRAGKYRVVIGNKVMEQGMNLQTGTTDMIHLTTPWDPGSYWQRLGRAQRQGNTTERIQNHILLAKGSFDQFTYSALMGKQGWTDVLWDPTNHGGANGAAMDALDQLQVLFADDKEAETKRLNAEREKIQVQQHAQMIKSTGDLMTTYFQTQAARERRQTEANARKKGPTPTDRAALARLDATMSKLRTTIDATPNYPFAAALRWKGDQFITKHGVPVHAGMTFKLPIAGQDTTITVKGVKAEDGTVFAESENGTLRQWLRPEELQSAHSWQVAPNVAALYDAEQQAAPMAKADTLSSLYRRMIRA